jgi:AcrR family transcriptional regulator
MEELLWTRVRDGGRGRVLSHDAVAQAAVRLADASGLDAVTMRAVAASLGVGTMSLYRYVATREELVDLMVDQVLGEITLDGAAPGWRGLLTQQARQTRALALRHPWMAMTGPASRPAMGPNMVAWLEGSLARLDQPGLSIDQVLDMDQTVRSFVVGFVQSELSERMAQRSTGFSEDEWRARMAPYLGALIATGDHPYLERIVRDAEDYPDPDVVFERRLGYVLDGLGAGLGLT